MWAALAAGAASAVLHGVGNAVASLAGILPGYLLPFRPRAVWRYVATYILQAAAFVAAYLIVGDHLPGGSPLVRGLAFGGLVVLLAAFVPLAPMALVHRQPLTRRDLMGGLVGGIVLGLPIGVVFVVVWEWVAG